jgi:hypothetical protein
MGLNTPKTPSPNPAQGLSKQRNRAPQARDELAARTGVSQETAQQAIDSLARLG